MELISKNENETKNIAKEFAKTLKKGDIIRLEGDLGAGKTAFTKGLCEYFNLSGVTSPTYAYLNIYGDFIYHYDFYRLSSGEDAERLGLIDYFGGDNICVLEWASNVEDVLPNDIIIVTIEKISENSRKITFWIT